MFDSRSDHPFRGVHHPRSWAEKATGGFKAIDGTGYWQPKRLRVQSKAAAIAEGLAEFEAEREERAIAADGLRECLDMDMTDYFRDFVGVRVDEPMTPHTSETDVDIFRVRKLMGMGMPVGQANQMIADLPPHAAAKVRKGHVHFAGMSAKRRAAKRPFSRTSAPVLSSWTRQGDLTTTNA